MVRDFDTGERYTYREHDFGWMEVLSNAEVVIGHNIFGFDLPALHKLFGFTLPKCVRIHDTLILSQILNYKRFGNKGHSLKVWGEALGYPKLDYDDFYTFSEEMVTYGERDVDLNCEIYSILLAELSVAYQKNSLVTTYIRAEMRASEFVSKANYNGWPFDADYARELFAEMEEKLNNTTSIVEAKLGRKCVAVDSVKGVVAVKKPKWNANGNYDHHLAKWFDIDPETGMDDDRLVEGEYCRVDFPRLKLSSVGDVKIFLYRNGWVPTEYNFKMNPVTLKKERTSPKITKDSLEFLGGDGKLYLEYLTIKSRHGILKTWLENLVETPEGTVIKGDCFLIGTPSMRARHSIIVNVPGSDSLYGPEMRKLFIARKGWKVVGCDSSGNQARGLAYYLQSPEYIDLILNGDVHQYNADKLTEVLYEMGIQHEVPRSAAKRVLYAFLFGAAGAKLWSYIFGTQKAKQGNTLKKGFTSAVPGFKNLISKLENFYWKTADKGEGYIESLVGTRIYVDSPHKLLVYLLQALEKITCSSAVMYAMDKLEAEGIPYIPLIYYHDEFEFMVPEQHAERAKEIGIEAFREAPKLYGIDIMDGDGRIGDNWYDVH
jgi:hypothetical protein